MIEAAVTVEMPVTIEVLATPLKIEVIETCVTARYFITQTPRRVNLNQSAHLWDAGSATELNMNLWFSPKGIVSDCSVAIVLIAFEWENARAVAGINYRLLQR